MSSDWTELTREEQETVRIAEIAASSETSALIAIIRRLDKRIDEIDTSLALERDDD